MANQDNFYIPAHAEGFRHRLIRFAEAVSRGDRLRLVALGSSSTAGEGDVVSYVYHLQKALRRKYSKRMVDVLNRGVGGQEAPEELQRLQGDVIDEAPSLVIWQVGTNAVWQRGRDTDAAAQAIAEGLRTLRAAAIDVILMDLQFAPALLTEDKLEGTRSILSTIVALAESGSINVFGRFDLMKRIVQHEQVAIDRLIDPADPQRLHQSDWAAQRIAYELSEAICAAAPPPSL